MGQRLASLRNFFKMDSEKSELKNSANVTRQSTPTTDMPNQNAEDNGNVELPPNETENTQNKSDENLNNERLDLGLDNHNSRFESIYSQQIDSQESKSTCNNGNFVPQSEAQLKPQAASCSSSSSSSSSNSSITSEDSPTNLPLRRTSKTLSFGKRRGKQRSKDQNPACNHLLSSKKKRSNWVLKFNCAKSKGSKSTDIPGQGNNNSECVCTGYRRTEELPMGAGVVFNSSSAPQSPILGPLPSSPVIDLSRFNPEEYPMEDCDERARLQRAREMEEGVEPPPGYKPNIAAGIQVHPNGITVDSLAALFQANAGIQAAALTALSQIDFSLIPNIERPAHTQVDYVHCLVPDLRSITACSFYWGKMDRYEAERLLEGKQEGTFLLRDSAQEEFLFSVSFRKYERSLHARVEQWNHKFSFDSHDPGVYASGTVCGLIEHYKDPSCCMFFEPVLTIPLHRTYAFPLQHLCRAIITTRTTYDGINKLQLPKTLKSYLKEYHYKQRVRVRRLDIESDLQ
ncbi:suppressor of cytokine signaling 5 isoform X2 [Neodiprion pinetum]|uniref:suppressor of cytokine signaling 5 isoform X2 n=1 Tax=Neodiprion pinetum TaxID=441929 RepID=UPI001EDDC49D|nr:suppressor of cytokine signaling 5 [Neodiprion pinetum]